MAGWTLLLFQKLHEVQYLSQGRLGQLFKMLVDKLGVGHGGYSGVVGLLA
jgi:hypothetical protein